MLALILIFLGFPGTTYEEQSVDGWQVLVEKTFLTEHSRLGDEVLAELHHQLFQISRKVPPAALEKLRSVPIWVHYDSKTRCMAYHPSGRWLKEHGFNAAMARGIEIGNAINFLDWTKQQPWMVFHELAHAYHDQVLGFNNAKIIEAFQRARKSSDYDSVLNISGKRQQHYAMTNPKEYFAEISEAFFGTNDFYPFVRAELKEHDPVAYNLLLELWGANPRR